MTINDILDYSLIKAGNVDVKIFSVLAIFLEFAICWFILFVIKRILNRLKVKKGLDEGRMQAFYQLTKYILYITLLLIILDTVGVNPSLLLAGPLAVLVGLGLGIQQIFQDIVSGIVLLFEGTINIGNIVEVDGIVGVVKKIKLRTSEVVTRDQINIIIPNNKLVSEKVINWSYNRKNTRFHVEVGVAYGTDPDLVKQLLEDAAKEHPDVVKVPEPLARFENFGDSALEFKLFFFSNEMLGVEFIKSDLRFKINKKFKENGITIPFPQRDLHIIEPKK